MQSLKLFQFLFNLIAWVLLYIFMRDKPPTAPSMSTKLKHESEESQRTQLTSPDRTPGQVTTANSTAQYDSLQKIWTDVKILVNNKDYVVLWVCFAIAVGLFNGLTAVINQFVGAVGYSYVLLSSTFDNRKFSSPVLCCFLCFRNSDAGFAAAIFVICGIIGTFVSST